ncbi:MAG TPA: hypothetical protein V6C81_19375 [Planktothrix sp.]|jgi:hypothetical protein
MKKKLWQWALVTVALVAVVMGVLHFWDRTAWPAFAADAKAPADAPQVVATVPRDFGWRTGDVIPIDLYIKQLPGTVVDTSNLAISGDFEIRTQPKAMIARKQSDGSTYMKLRFEVQSFNVSKSWTLNANMTYARTAAKDDQTVSLPALVVYTSMTYDGRADIQQGPQKLLISILEAVFTFGCVLAGVLGTIVCFVWYNHLNKPIVSNGKYPLTPLLQVKRNFDLISVRIKRGDFSPQNYEELERNLRWLYKLEAKTRGQIELSVQVTNHPYKNEITTIVSLCDKRLYDKVLLTDEEHEAIFQAFQRIFTGQPSALKLQER